MKAPRWLAATALVAIMLVGCAASPKARSDQHVNRVKRTATSNIPPDFIQNTIPKAAPDTLLSVGASFLESLPGAMAESQSIARKEMLVRLRNVIAAFAERSHTAGLLSERSAAFAVIAIDAELFLSNLPEIRVLAINLAPDGSVWCISQLTKAEALTELEGAVKAAAQSGKWDASLKTALSNATLLEECYRKEAAKPPITLR
jgi:hypothetical protein